MAHTIFHLIRHGEHDIIGHAVAGRTPGISLNVRGRAQAEAIGAALGDRPVVAIIATPLERTQETAAPLAKRRGMPVCIEPALIDIDFGDWTMIPFDRLHHDPRWPMFNRFRSGAAIPGGETMAAVQARAVGALLRLRREFPAGDVAIFCHGDVIKSLIMHFLGVALDFVHRIEISPGSRSTLLLEDESAKLLALNLPASAPGPP
jgi:broad specificity phosphatase PhoE